MKQILLLIIIFALFLIPCSAQNSYYIFLCRNAIDSKSFVGGRFKMSFPKGAIVRKGKDIDYSNFSIGFGKKKSRFWMSGIFGPMATSGQVPSRWIDSSKEVTKRTWTTGEFEGIDAKGKLANGNNWRYFGIYGEAVQYYDVSAEAALYFDNIINTVCYDER